MYKEEMYTHERECTGGGGEVHTQKVGVQEVHSQKGMYKRAEKYIYEMYKDEDLHLRKGNVRRDKSTLTEGGRTPCTPTRPPATRAAELTSRKA